MPDYNWGNQLKKTVTSFIDQLYAYFTSDDECEYVEAKRPEGKLIDFQMTLEHKKG